MLNAIAAEALHATDIRATLCRGEHPRRRSGDERTVFKALGSALEDLTAATLVRQDATSKLQEK